MHDLVTKYSFTTTSYNPTTFTAPDPTTAIPTASPLTTVSAAGNMTSGSVTGMPSRSSSAVTTESTVHSSTGMSTAASETPAQYTGAAGRGVSLGDFTDLATGPVGLLSACWMAYCLLLQLD